MGKSVIQAIDDYSRTLCKESAATQPNLPIAMGESYKFQEVQIVNATLQRSNILCPTSKDCFWSHQFPWIKPRKTWIQVLLFVPT